MASNVFRRGNQRNISVLGLGGCLLVAGFVGCGGVNDVTTSRSPGDGVGGEPSAGAGNSGGAGDDVNAGGQPEAGAGGATGPGAAAGAGAAGGAGEAGGAGGAGATAGAGGAGGDGSLATKSCAGLAATCGPAGKADCCASNLVTGGTFKRGNDASYPATVSDFRLDNYEITVGRFRKFLDEYSPDMIPSGAGKNPNNASDKGWDPAWNASLAATPLALASALKCGAQVQTWTDAAGIAAAESRPINCLDWFEAEAFCIWDGGRLPTEAEWNYAAAGGAEQRTYPWGNAAPDCSYANFRIADFCVSPGTGALSRVGSASTKGDGLYGQSDLAGNVWEWVQDWHVSPYTNPCTDCANTAVPSFRVFRGGSYGDDASRQLTSYRSYNPPTSHGPFVGARCARNP